VAARVECVNQCGTVRKQLLHNLVIPFELRDGGLFDRLWLSHHMTESKQLCNDLLMAVLYSEVQRSLLNPVFHPPVRGSGQSDEP